MLLVVRPLDDGRCVGDQRLRGPAQVVEVVLSDQRVRGGLLPAGRPALYERDLMCVVRLEGVHLPCHPGEIRRDARVERLVLPDQREFGLRQPDALAIRLERRRVPGQHITADTRLLVQHLVGEILRDREERPRLVDEAVIAEGVDPPGCEHSRGDEREDDQDQQPSAPKTGCRATRSGSVSAKTELPDVVGAPRASSSRSSRSRSASRTGSNGFVT